MPTIFAHCTPPPPPTARNKIEQEFSRVINFCKLLYRAHQYKLGRNQKYHTITNNCPYGYYTIQ